MDKPQPPECWRRGGGGGGWGWGARGGKLASDVRRQCERHHFLLMSPWKTTGSCSLPPLVTFSAPKQGGAITTKAKVESGGGGLGGGHGRRIEDGTVSQTLDDTMVSLFASLHLNANFIPVTLQRKCSSMVFSKLSTETGSNGRFRINPKLLTSSTSSTFFTSN